MEQWLKHRPVFLDELLRLDGLGDAHDGPGVCPDCLNSQAQIKCNDCFEGIMRCSACAVSFHKNLPLHRIQVRWVSRTTLARVDAISVVERRFLRKRDPRKPRPCCQSRSPLRHLSRWYRNPADPRNRPLRLPFRLHSVLHVLSQFIPRTFPPAAQGPLVPGISTSA